METNGKEIYSLERHWIVEEENIGINTTAVEILGLLRSS